MRNVCVSLNPRRALLFIYSIQFRDELMKLISFCAKLFVLGYLCKTPSVFPMQWDLLSPCMQCICNSAVRG